MIEKKTTELHAIFKGHVQGVGFRYTIRRLAAQYSISGWVRNQADGTVEMIAQGPRKGIEQLLSDIISYFKHNIFEQKLIWDEVRNVYNGFNITY